MLPLEEPELIGRRRETETLARLLDDARDGAGGAVVVRGDPGVGKSALLEYLERHAPECRVMRVAGIESEMQLAFAGLHQLCAPVLELCERLPSPQRQALEVAFGLSAAPAVDRSLIGLAVLGLLSEVGSEQPLVCIVDDAQWLDQESAQIIGFVARRLLAERVLFVCAARTGIGDEVLRGLPELPVDGLLKDDARALLRNTIHAPVDDAVRDQIIAESHGNPLALIELPRTWSAADLAGGFGLPASRALAGKIEHSYGRRIDLLPTGTRLLMLAAAAEPLGDPALLRGAAATLGVDIAAVAPAVDAGLISIAERVQFAHPLVRSATYRMAADDDRRRAHAALADATNAERDPDRRVWHRACATRGPDEELAAELELSAGRVQARGGIAATAAFLQRALALTSDPARRGQRALAAAQMSLLAGAFAEAFRLVATAEAGRLDELQRAQVDLIRAQIAFASSRGTEATPLLLAAARRLEQLDASLARETYVDAFSAALFGARLNQGVGVAEVALAAQDALRGLNGEAATADLLLEALVALADDYEMAVPACRLAVQRLSGEQISARERLRWLWQGCVVALEIWDDDGAYLLSQRSIEIARETGTLSELALALSARTPILVFCGELYAAGGLVGETRSVEEASGISSAPYGALILEAWQGKARDTSALIESTLRDASARGEGIGVAISEYARAVLSNGLGQYQQALAAARSASEHQEVVAENWGLSELIEPATRTGNVDVANDALERLSKKARGVGTDWALGIEARSRGLISEGDRAESCFREAIERLSRTRVRAELARAHLLYGEWLRRENRRVDGRAQLRLAHEQFASMGMEAFAERARGELLATGERVRKRTADTRDDLTAQERQIAHLARDGLSNPEIGARLFLSPRTVEWHLRKVFTKLNIRNRRDLVAALPLSDSELIRA